jgi:hypothetical protein
MGDKRRLDPLMNNAMTKNAIQVDKVDIEQMMIFWLASQSEHDFKIKFGQYAVRRGKTKDGLVPLI